VKALKTEKLAQRWTSPHLCVRYTVSVLLPTKLKRVCFLGRILARAKSMSIDAHTSLKSCSKLEMLHIGAPHLGRSPKAHETFA
jgi:hypothetical protein